MKKHVLPLCLALALLLSGCSALLERSYVSVEPHNENPVADGDNAALRVETYQELVNAILYYVSHGEAEGSVHLYNYTRDVESDLEKACLEVVQEDPLGAYAVDYIKYDFKHIVSYYEAQVQITYRRTAEQRAGIVSVTGSSAIRAELAEAMEQFDGERVLRIGYFDETAVDLEKLAREAYYAAPASAFGMPEVTFTLYPAETTGRQRIVEVSLTYPEATDALLKKREELLKRLLPMQDLLDSLTGEAAGRAVFALVRENARYAPDEAEHATAYDALIGGSANSEGIALATKLICDLTEVECTVTRGEEDGLPHFTVTMDWGEGARSVDATRPDGFDPAGLASAP